MTPNAETVLCLYTVHQKTTDLSFARTAEKNRRKEYSMVQHKTITTPRMQIHVYPLNDLRPHETDGKKCWCNPQEDDEVIIHNSMDKREEYENGRRLS